MEGTKVLQSDFTVEKAGLRTGETKKPLSLSHLPSFPSRSNRKYGQSPNCPNPHPRKKASCTDLTTVWVYLARPVIPSPRLRMQNEEYTSLGPQGWIWCEFLCLRHPLEECLLGPGPPPWSGNGLVPQEVQLARQTATLVIHSFQTSADAETENAGTQSEDQCVDLLQVREDFMEEEMPFLMQKARWNHHPKCNQWGVAGVFLSH